MVTYRRRKGDKHDAWHWCTNCSNWPTKDYEEIEVEEGKRPSTGELDNQCKAKEKARNCTKY